MISQRYGRGKFPAGAVTMITVVVVDPETQIGVDALLKDAVANDDFIVLRLFIAVTRSKALTERRSLDVISPSKPTLKFPEHVDPSVGQVHTND